MRIKCIYVACLDRLDPHFNYKGELRIIFYLMH